MSQYQKAQRERFTTFYVGIDIAKLNPFASIVSAEYDALVTAFKFPTNNDGFRFDLRNNFSVFTKLVSKSLL